MKKFLKIALSLALPFFIVFAPLAWVLVSSLVFIFPSIYTSDINDYTSAHFHTFAGSKSTAGFFPLYDELDVYSSTYGSTLTIQIAQGTIIVHAHFFLPLR